MNRAAPVGKNDHASPLLIIVIVAVICASVAGLWFWLGAVDDAADPQRVEIYGDDAETYLRVDRANRGLPPPSQDEIDRVRQQGLVLVDP